MDTEHRGDAAQTTFRGLRLRVSNEVFRPRRETETTAGLAVDEAGRRRAAVVVDLGTGSGAIALSVAAEVPGSLVYAVDVDPAAVRVTANNADRLGLAVRPSVGDVTDPHLLDELTGRADVVVANPPFIPDGLVPRDPEVRESRVSLYGGPDGLDVIRAVVAAARRLLRPGGLLLVQHGDIQGADVRSLIVASGGYGPVRTRCDHEGRERVARARRSRS